MASKTRTVKEQLLDMFLELLREHTTDQRSLSLGHTTNAAMEAKIADRIYKKADGRHAEFEKLLADVFGRDEPFTAEVEIEGGVLQALDVFFPDGKRIKNFLYDLDDKDI